MTKLNITTTPEEHRLATDMTLNDHVYLARYAMARFPAVAEAHVIVAMGFNADGAWSWRKLASYTLNELKSIEAERELLPYEVQLRSIAERIYDAEVKVADRFGLDLFPEDTDRAAARRQLDEAVQRAIPELQTTTVTNKETKQ
jgi:hypothetical protein